MIDNIIFNKEKMEYYKNDILTLWEYPNSEISQIFIFKKDNKLYHLDLSLIESNQLKDEIKTYIENCIINYDMHIKLNRMIFIQPLHYLINYLGINGIDSFKVINTYYINKYIKYLIEQNINISIENRKTYALKIIFRITKFVVCQLSVEEQIKIGIFILNDEHDISFVQETDMLFFAVLSHNIKELFILFFTSTLKLNLSNSNFKNRYISPLRFLIEYCVKFEIKNWNDIDFKEYEKYLSLEGHATRFKSTKRSPNLTIIDKIYEYIDANSTDDLFKRDLWNLSELIIESNRKNKTLMVESFNFIDIININNRNYVKKYIKHLIANTSLSISTIKGKITHIKRVLSKVEKDLILLSYDELFKSINIKGDSNEISYNSNIEMKLFTDYLYNQGRMSYILLKREDIKRPKRKHIYRTVENLVVDQIFNVLDKFQTEIALIYLIIYCTGVRISEALAVKSDYLYVSNKNFYIKTFSTKMKKEQDNIIPENLYIMINAYIKEHCISGKKEFVFKGRKDIDGPMKYSFFRDTIHEEIKKYDIRCSSGVLYNIDIHGYRHRLGTEMHKNSISWYIIQKVLHHESIEMTMAYIDIFEKDIKDSYTQFYNYKGKQLPPDSESVKMILFYLNHAINAQALSNGICALPAKFNKCEHANVCLTCSNFCTSREHLQTLKKQMEETEIILENAKKNNWKMQIATNEEVKKNLKLVIDAVEKGD